MHAALLNLHSFAHTHQRGRGDELSTRVHFGSGQVNRTGLCRFTACRIHRDKHVTHASEPLRRVHCVASLPKAKCAKVSGHTSKVKISYKPSIAAKKKKKLVGEKKGKISETACDVRAKKCSVCGEEKKKSVTNIFKSKSR